jgi:hypothetical protein
VEKRSVGWRSRGILFKHTCARDGDEEAKETDDDGGDTTIVVLTTEGKGYISN